MRYDIYSAITYELSDYRLESKAGEILRGILPIRLEKKVNSITRNCIEFNLDPKRVEAIANSEYSLENHKYRDIIDFSVSLLKPIENIMEANSEEVIGYNKATDNLHYSCLEIIKGKDNTLFVAGNVVLQPTKNEPILLEARLGKYIYENDFVSNHPQLKELITYKQYDLDIYEKLHKIQKTLWRNGFIIPENYTTITAGKMLNENTIKLNNDGEIVPKAEYDETFKEIFGGKLYTNYNYILKGLNQISDYLFLDGFVRDSYGKFNSLEFIESIIKDEKAKKGNKPKQLQKK